MPKARCSHCGHVTGFAEGMTEVYCECCDFKMTIRYKVEKIEGDPVSYLLNRSKSIVDEKSEERST